MRGGIWNAPKKDKKTWTTSSVSSFFAPDEISSLLLLKQILSCYCYSDLSWWCAMLYLVLTVPLQLKMMVAGWKVLIYRDFLKSNLSVEAAGFTMFGSWTLLLVRKFFCYLLLFLLWCDAVVNLAAMSQHYLDPFWVFSWRWLKIVWRWYECNCFLLYGFGLNKDQRCASQCWTIGFSEVFRYCSCFLEFHECWMIGCGFLL